MVFTQEVKTYTHIEMCFIHNCQTWKQAGCFSVDEMNKQTVVHLEHGILFSTNKK